MKKLFLFIIFLICTLQGMSQNIFDIYYEGEVVESIPVGDVDSINVSSDDENRRLVNFYRNGEIFLNYDSEVVDSIIVNNSGVEPLSFIGIVGFNQELYVKNIGVLSPTTSSQYKTFVNNLTKKDGSLLYYAEDCALNMIENYSFPPTIKNINLITFTDGLDQGSLMMNSNYANEDDYLNALSHRIANTFIESRPLTAYSLGLLGKDVYDHGKFMKNLKKLASKPDNAIEVNSMNDVNDKLQDIANQIVSINSRQTVSLKIPGVSDGTIVRFIFDDASPQNSQMYIEGTLNLQERSLNSVIYNGITAPSGSFIQGTQDGIFIVFTFTGLQRADGNGLIPTNNIRQYNMPPNSTSWQINSEFKPSSNTLTTTTHSSTAILLVLDCSSSLGQDFSKMKQYAQNFINKVADNAAPFDVSPPANVKASLDDEQLAVNVSWDVVKNAESYSVWRCNKRNGTFNMLKSGITSNSWTDELPLNDNYYIVYAFGKGFTSTASNVSNGVSCYLEPPANLYATLSVVDSVLGIYVTWDSVKYAKCYSVYRSHNNSNSYSLIADSVTANGWTDLSPLSGVNYYKVLARNRNFISPLSVCFGLDYIMPSPQNLSAKIEEVDSSLSIKLVWDSVAYAQFYTVYRSKNNSSYSFSQIADSITTSSWMDGSPLEGYNYYKIKANGYGLSSSYSDYAIVNCKLESPTNVKASLDDEDFVINVTWDAVSHAEYYAIYRSSSSSGSFSMVADSITSTSWTDKTPLSGYNYYRVYAKNHGITSNASNSSNFVNYTLAVPTNVQASMDDEDFAINVSWDAVNYAECYAVYRSKSSYGSFSMVVDSITSTSWTDKTPLSGYNYYRVYAKSHGITSNASNSSNFVNYTLAVPTNVQASLDEEDFVINVSWDAVNHAEFYAVYRSKSSSGSFTMVADSITSTSWTDKAPLNGYNYYKVYSKGHGIISNASNCSNNVNYTLSAPTHVQATLDEEDFVINVSWDAVNHAEFYAVYRSKSSSGSFAMVADSITSTAWTDKAPLSGNNYYKVYAMSHGITSGVSNPSNNINYSLEVPTNVKASLDEEEFVINVNWDAVWHAECYAVYRSSSSSGAFSIVADSIASTSWIDKTPFKGYNYYKVYAKGHGTTSVASNSSNSVNYTIAAPSNVKASLDDEDFVISVSWDAVNHAECYAVYRSKSSSGSFTMVADSITSTTWTDKAPLKGYNYYKVYAKSHGITSNASYSSNSVNYTISAPSNVKAALDEETFVINVTWNAVNHAECYAVYRSKSSSGSFAMVADSITSTAWTDKTPLNGYNYYRVYAKSHGITSASDISNNVYYTIDVPKNVYASLDNNNNVVRVGWDSVSHAEYYAVYRSRYLNSTYELIADSVTSNKWTDSAPLICNYYKVKAKTHGIESNFSIASNEVMLSIGRTFKVNGVNFKMINVDGGTFQMGSTTGDSDEKPLHIVTLSDYYIGETEVTQELWMAVMGNNPSSFSGTNLPVENVSWEDCQTFINKLNQLTGLLFRLPSEAEWEFAAIGGAKSEGYNYSGSNNITEAAWYNSNSYYRTQEVGKTISNELGIFDMSGNVKEWCQDWYGSYNNSEQTNPTGASSGSNRVERGGSWNDSPKNCRVRNRDYDNPAAKKNNVGLRIALSR